jgi:hypothetical protein
MREGGLGGELLGRVVTLALSVAQGSFQQSPPDRGRWSIRWAREPSYHVRLSAWMVLL